MGTTSGAEDSDKQGIDLEVCNRQRVMQRLRILKIPVAKEADLKTAVSLLETRYRTDYEKNGVASSICDRCNGVVPQELEVCPFCGEAFNAPESSRIGGGSSEIDSEATIERGETALATAAKTVFVAPIAPNARPIPKPTEDQLEVAVGNIQRMKRTFGENAWDIGNELNRIAHETAERPALWRLRTGLAADDVKKGGGKVAYDNFQQFLRAEIGMSMRMAKSLQHVAREYTRDEVPLHSVAKIEIVLTAPEPERKRLMAKAATTPLRELRTMTRDLNLAAGRGEKQRKGVATVKARKAQLEIANAPAPAPAPEIVGKKGKAVPVEEAKSPLLTMVLGKASGKFPLYREQKDAKGKLTPAHSASDAYGWFETQNGITFTLKLDKTADGKLIVRYTAKRAEH